MRKCIVGLGMCFVLACSGSRQGASVEGQSGAPDRASCLVDDDCVAAPLVSPDLCCDTGVPGEVVSRAFDDWRRTTRAHRCEGVACPPAPSPALPRPCAVEPRCVANQCTHACEEVEPVAGRPSTGASEGASGGGSTGASEGASGSGSTGALEGASGGGSTGASEGGSSEALRARVVAARSQADGRWMRVEVVASGLVGCEVATAETSCPPGAEVRALGRREWRELDERWANVLERGRCRAARIDDTAWTPIRIFSAQETIDARTPADPESLHPPECFSLPHLVGWMTRVWRARPPTAR